MARVKACVSLAKYCVPHISYRQLIDLGYFDYDSSEVWKLKRQTDRDVVNDEFLSGKIRQKWFREKNLFADTRHIQFIRGSHSTMLLDVLNRIPDDIKIHKFCKIHNINYRGAERTWNKLDKRQNDYIGVMTKLFEHYGVSKHQNDYTDLFYMHRHHIIYHSIIETSRT